MFKLHSRASWEVGGNESFVEQLNPIFSKLINSQRTYPFMDFAVKNKANLSTPCIICQLGHKEQKSSLSCYSFDHIMEEKKNVLALSLVLSRPTSVLLQSHPNIVPAFCLELIYRVTTQPSGSSQKPQHGLTCLAAKAHPTSTFGLNLPQFGLNARCLFDISAAVATLRSHLGSRGQNPRSDGWLDGCPAESSRA